MKKLRNILVAICLMLCTVVLASCGGGQLKTEAGVSKKGFATATKEDYTAFAEGKTFKADGFTSYRVTQTSESEGRKTYQNAIVTMNDKGELTGIAMKADFTESEKKTAMEFYYTEATIYFHLDNGTDEINYKIPTPDLDKSMLSGGLIESVEVDGAFLLDSIETFASFMDKAGVKIEKAGKGDKVRFHVGIPAESSQPAMDLYVEFNGEQLVGAELLQVSGDNTMMAAYETFKGDIKFPSFKKYTDPDLEKLATLLEGLFA